MKDHPSSKTRWSLKRGTTAQGNNILLGSSVSDDLFFSSCSFFVLLLVLSFSRLILSLSFLCSSVSEALLALSFSFLSERLLSFFVHAKAALAYSRNE